MPVNEGRLGSRDEKLTYSVLLQRVRNAGLLGRRHRYYVTCIAINVMMHILGWTAFVLIGDSWWQLALACFMVATFAQSGFIGHDAGHLQIALTRRRNEWIGILAGNLAIGMSFGWWTDKHRRHHKHPNCEGLDPDVSISALMLTQDQADNPGRLHRAVSKYQAYLFIPLLSFEALAMHVHSAKFLLRPGARHRTQEIVFLVLHTVGYFGLVFGTLSPTQGVVFAIFHQALLGIYLGLVFAPNHKGMASMLATDRLNFLSRQVLTSRNITGGVATRILFGGLNYQIEHHLFPSMARPNLRQARRIVRAFCWEARLPYCEASLVCSYRDILAHLNSIGHSNRMSRDQSKRS